MRIRTRGGGRQSGREGGGGRRIGLIAASVLLVGGAALVGCGGDSSDGGSSDADMGVADAGTEGGRDDDDAAAPGAPTDDQLGAARDIAQQAIDNTSDDARATVVIDGTTYEFRPVEPGPDDDFFSFCTVIAGSLQGGMQLVDDAGAVVDGGGLEFVLLEPGGAYAATGDPAEVGLVLPEHNGVGYLADSDVDAPLSGRSASGTFTVVNHFGDSISGTIDASC